MVKSFLTGTLLLLVLGAESASAQWAVVDAGAAATAQTTAASLLAQINHYAAQIKQMEKDCAYMAKQLQSLGELGWEDSYRLREHINFFDSLKGRTDSLMFDYRQTDERFRSLYKSTGKPVKEKFAEWNAQSESSMLAAMKSHGVVDDTTRKMESVSSLLEKQRRAQGDLAAIQTLGELNAIQSQQLEELKTIIALDSRAKQSQAMESNSQRSAAAEHEKHLLSDIKKKRKSKPMRKLPNLGHGVEY